MFKNSTLISMVVASVTALSLQASPGLAQSSHCNAQSLSALLDTDLSTLTHKKLDIKIGNSMAGAVINAYYTDQSLNVIIAEFKGSGGRADMNFYLLDKSNYLMEYHLVQNSNFYDENDSVILTDEKSYFHVCDNALLAPAFGGIIDEDIYQNMKLVLDVILTEESAP